MLSKGDRSGIVLGSMAVGSGGLGWIRVGILESQFQDFLWIVETVGRVKENPLRMYCTCTRDVFFFFSILLSLTKRVSCKLGGRALEPGLHTNFASIDPMCILEFLFLFLVLSVGDSVLVCHWVPREPKNKKGLGCARRKRIFVVLSLANRRFRMYSNRTSAHASALETRFPVRVSSCG